jgi:hypothetical protein
MVSPTFCQPTGCSVLQPSAYDVRATSENGTGLTLRRSVFMKGVGAAALESVEAARRRGAEEWLRGELAAVVGEPLLERFLSGSVAHAERRVDEMAAAAAYLRELGVEPRVAEAAGGWLRQLAGERRARPA